MFLVESMIIVRYNNQPHNWKCHLNNLIQQQSVCHFIAIAGIDRNVEFQGRCDVMH